MNVQQLIDRYKLIPHTEGGYYREVYRSAQTLLSPAAGQQRNALTHIYFLLVEGQVSRFHRVVHDEVWNFYEGEALKLIRFDGNNISETLIGPVEGEFVSMVKGGMFQAAETTGDFSLVGCTVAPGFEFEDFSFLSDDPELKQRLIDNYPDYRRLL